MVFSFAKRMLTEPDPRLLRKFAYNFGIKGIAVGREVQAAAEARRILSAVSVHLGDLRLPVALPGLLGGCRGRSRNTSRSTT